MISSYRLGDLIFLGLNSDETNKLLFEYPNSFGSEYIEEKQKNPDSNNIDIITTIVLKHIDNYKYNLPQDIENSTLIHLRLGDVISGDMWHEKRKRPFEPEYIKSLIQNNTDKKYVIGKCFFAETSSTNYVECIIESNKYLNKILQTFNAEHYDSGNADIDLCCAIKSKLFVQGRGYFSKLIVEIRKKLGLECIENICES
jgi:hypothetical protein